MLLRRLARLSPTDNNLKVLTFTFQKEVSEADEVSLAEQDEIFFSFGKV